MFRTALLVLCAVLFTQSSAYAEEDVSLALFGEGLHEYFAGEYELAFDLFSDAIEAGGRDPRPYYFRGLTLVQVDRAEAAEPDFKTGAELESKMNPGAFPVGKSLSRIQGKLRMKLEAYRREARLKMLNERSPKS